MKKKIEPGIFQTGPNTYRVRIATNIKGKYLSKKKSNLKTRGEARRVLKEFQEQLVLEKYKILKGISSWRKAKEEYFKMAQEQLSPSTLHERMLALENYTKEWDEDLTDEFYREQIMTFINDKLSGKSSETKNNLAKYIRCVFQHQVSKGILKENPAKGIIYKRGDLKEKKLEAMDKSEVEYLIEQAFEQNHLWAPVWYVMYQTGMRSGEGLELKVSDIDFQQSKIFIQRAYCSKTKAVKSPKNGKMRVVPLNKQLAAFLKELKLKAENGYILPRFKDWKNGKAAEVLRAFQKEIGIRETNFHSLRASFITHLLLSGVSVVKVQHLVGHADLKTTQRYIRLMGSDLVGSTESIGIDLDKRKGEILKFK